MDSGTTTFGAKIFRRHALSSGRAAPALAGIGAALAWVRGVPVLMWSLILAAALLAFFVHLLNEQVLRGQLLREEQRAAAVRQSAHANGDARRPRDRLVATRSAAGMP
ncbi:MAG TPA: hypothetical protein VEZ89_01615 [Rubrivivax sp.]|nr:hypothetical protein [Rubrivivax sp.]